MTASQEPRQNRDGHPCPPWCTADHDGQLFPGYFTKSHGGENTLAGFDLPISVRPSLAPSWDAPRVQVAGVAPSLFLEDGASLAELIDRLAGATPEQHRELAAAIRKAAAVIEDAGGAR
jgi:hypothetical protein